MFEPHNPLPYKADIAKIARDVRLIRWGREQLEKECRERDEKLKKESR